jgi:hypothetical protein
LNSSSPTWKPGTGKYKYRPNRSHANRQRSKNIFLLFGR